MNLSDGKSALPEAASALGLDTARGCQSQMFGELVSQVPDVGHSPFSSQGEAPGLRFPRDYGLWNCVSASPNHRSVAFSCLQMQSTCSASFQGCCFLLVFFCFFLRKLFHMQL